MLQHVRETLLTNEFPDNVKLLQVGRQGGGLVCEWSGAGAGA